MVMGCNLEYISVYRRSVNSFMAEKRSDDLTESESESEGDHFSNKFGMFADECKIKLEDDR